MANFVVAVNWKDRWFLPSCIHSIRRYYPRAKITLLKDTFRGAVETRRIQQVFDVEIMPLQRGYGGGGWIKLLPAIMGSESEGFAFPLLILDADTIVQGPVFEELLEIKGKLVVSPDLYAVHPRQDYIETTYFDYKRLPGIEPDSERIKSFPWFNSGHYLINEPFIEEEFSNHWIDWSAKPVCARSAKTYPLSDQSFLNHYLLLNEQIKIGALDFADWAGDLEGWQLARKQNYYKAAKWRVLHYAGCARIPFWKMPAWRIFLKESLAAERALGNMGSLLCSHGLQSLFSGILRGLGKEKRAALKRLLAER